MQLTLTAALKQKESRTKLGTFSKQWAPGNTYRVFYPIVANEETGQYEYTVGGVWGYAVNDMKELGIKTTFIPALMGVDENGELLGNLDITGQFASIAPVFVASAKEKELQEIGEKNFPSEELRKEALKRIETKYDKDNLKAVKPVIGRLSMKLAIEAVMVPIVNQVLQIDKAVVVSQPLSTKKARTLIDLLSDPKYAPQAGDAFFEVEYNYPMDTDKGRSGNSVTISGLTQEYKTAVAAPTDYARLKSKLDSLARDEETIVRHCTTNVNESKIRQCITSYAFMHSADLEHCSEDNAETLAKNVNIIKEISLMQAIQPGALKAKLEEALAKQVDEVATEAIPEAVLPAEGAPSLDSLISGNTTVNEDAEDAATDNIDFNIGSFN